MPEPGPGEVLVIRDGAATLVEPLACCVRGLRRARVGRGTRLLVIGGGQMGLLTALAGLAAGATVAVAEPLPDRRALASALGAAGVAPEVEAAAAALDLIAAGAIPADRLVTHRFPLERTEEALAAARSRAGVKVIVTSSA